MLASLANAPTSRARRRSHRWLAPGFRAWSAGTSRRERRAAAWVRGRATTRCRVAAALLVALVLTSACSGIGPGTVRRDQAGFVAAVEEAAKRQALLNIVKRRYADVPTFLDVGQIVAGYTLERRIELGTGIFRSDLDLSDDVRFGAGGTFSDRPTVTYAPVHGRDFVRLALTPLPPGELFTLMLAGAPTELVLALGVHALNDLGQNSAEAAFHEAGALMAGLARDDRLRFRFDGRGEERAAVLLLRDPPGQPPDPRVPRLLGLLGLDPRREGYAVTFGLGRRRGDRLAVFTRSVLEVLDDLADRVEVPEAHVRSGRALPARSDRPATDPLAGFRVRRSALQPYGAFASVRYEGGWYWIAADDLASKQVFTALLLVLSLVGGGDGRTDLPVITIPAG